MRARDDGLERTITIPCDREPAFVRIDPGAFVLCDATYALGVDVHIAILASEPDVVARIGAARALARDGSHRAFDALSRAIERDPFWGVAAEIATALASTSAPRARTILIAAAAHAHPKVRRAVAAALGAFPSTSEAAQALTQLASDASYFVVAEAYASIGRSRAPDAFATLEAALAVPSWQETIAAGALRGLAELGDERTVALVLNALAIDRPPLLREAALAVIPRLDASLEGRLPALVEAIIRAIDDAHFDVRRAGIAAAEKLAAPRARPPLARIAADREAGFLQRMAADAVEAIDRAARVPVEIERLRSDLTTLRAQVATLREGKGER